MNKIEETLRGDARGETAGERQDALVALELLKPHISKAGIAAKRREKQRKDRIVFFSALAVFATLIAAAGITAFQGKYDEIAAIGLVLAGFALCALLLLPILEKFLPEQNAR